MNAITKKRKSISTFMNGNQTETINHCLSVNVNKKCKCIDRDFGITNQFCQTTYEKLFHYSIFCWAKKMISNIYGYGKIIINNNNSIAMLQHTIVWESERDFINGIWFWMSEYEIDRKKLMNHNARFVDRQSI